jgi:(heptosyl)LPS beta-1,4-glucosyltransferase
MEESKPKLSVALAVYNESDNLGACLDSIKGIASEIVIVDGGSTDGTREIAQKYGAKVQVEENRSNFHINKQARDRCM